MKFSVIVPSFRQARFLPATLDSLLSQKADLEIIVQDGGSADGSVEIIEKYSRDFPGTMRWESKPDGGQTNGVNLGIEKSTGEILGYLNSDDILYPGALARVGEYFEKNPEAQVLYGEADHIDENGNFIGAYPTEPWNYRRLLETCFICQPACFWRRGVVEKHGLFDGTLHYSMDLEYWLRVGKREVFHFLPVKLAGSRCHGQAKRFEQEGKVREEALRVVLKHNHGRAPLPWVVGLARSRASRRIQKGGSVFEILFFSLSYWVSLSVNLRLAENWRGLSRKLIPPIRSEFEKRKNPFYHL